MKTKRIILASAFIFFLIFIGTTPSRASEYEEDRVPSEYGDFISSLPDYVIEDLPDTALDDNKSSLYEAAEELSRPTSVLSAILRGFGSQISSVILFEERIILTTLLAPIFSPSKAARLFTTLVTDGIFLSLEGVKPCDKYSPFLLPSGVARAFSPHQRISV